MSFKEFAYPKNSYNKNVSASPSFNAGFANNSLENSYAHGDIEKEALKEVFTETEILQIYFGNWLRDFSQVICGASLKFLSQENWAKNNWATINQ